MKKTTTRTKEIWVACNCGGSKHCPLCQGTGKFLSETQTEIIIEETTGDREEVVEAEEIVPALEHT